MSNKRTNIYFDTEFTGLHQKTTLISIGLVSECGKTFYAEFTDYDQSQVDDWIKDNVISNLTLDVQSNIANNDNWRLLGDTRQIKEGLQVWLSQFSSVRMVSDLPCFDWVLFCNIFGHAFNIPPNVYYIPLDIVGLFEAKGIDNDISREEFALNDSHGLGGSKKHNALWDAYVIRECYKKLTS